MTLNLNITKNKSIRKITHQAVFKCSESLNKMNSPNNTNLIQLKLIIIKKRNILFNGWLRSKLINQIDIELDFLRKFFNFR